MIALTDKYIFSKQRNGISVSQKGCTTVKILAYAKNSNSAEKKKKKLLAY